MFRHTKLLAAAIIMTLCAASVLALARPAYAVDPFTSTGVCSTSAAQSSPACKTNGSNPLTGKDGILIKVARLLSLVAAIGAVIVIAFGGFMYVTAGGDAGRANNGRKAIIGAVVGLVVIAAAQVFIALVLNLVT